MIWIAWAFLNTFFASMMDIANKKVINKVDEYWLGFAMRLFTVILFVPLVLGLGDYFFSMPFILGGWKFWASAAFVGLANIVAVVCFLKALGETELSLVVPLTVFTPLFLLFLGPLIGEIPSLAGLSGVLLIMVGTYALHMEKLSEGFLKPLKAIAHRKGSKLVLISAFIWALNNIVGKIGILETNALSWTFMANVIGMLAFIPVIILMSKKSFNSIMKEFRAVSYVGFFRTLMVFSHNMAISMGYVAYVIAIKRLSILFTVVLSYFMLGEIDAKKRVFGSTLMVLGVVLITIF